MFSLILGLVCLLPLVGVAVGLATNNFALAVVSVFPAGFVVFIILPALVLA